jgi:AcrR family transcriptional regulator
MKKKDESKYETIIQAAIKIIVTEGAAGLSTTKVAKAVGISQSNIYIYFKNKSDMLTEVFEHEQAVMRSMLVSSITAEPSIEGQIRVWLRTLYHIAVERPDTLTTISQIKQLPDSPVVNRVAADPADQHQNVVAEMLSAGIASGDLRVMPVQVFMTMAFGAIVTYARQKRDKIEREQEFEQLYVMLWSAMQNKS